MLRSYTIYGGQFGYVDQYYHQGAWRNVESWNVLEDRGEPPLIIEGQGEITTGRGKGKIRHCGDCKTHGFYDYVNFLSGYAEPDMTFEELEATAKALQIGGHGYFDRRRKTFVGTEGFAPCLVTMAGSVILPEFARDKDLEALIVTLQRRQPSITNIYPAGPRSLYFDFDVDLAVDTKPQ